MGAGAYDKRITILQRGTGRDPQYNTPVPGSWAPFAEDIAANVRDFLPSRAERVAEGINLALKPARIRVRYRDGITTSMRVQFGARTLEIVSGPAELGRREGLEFIAQELSVAGEAL